MPDLLNELAKARPPGWLGPLPGDSTARVDARGVIRSRPVALWMIALGLGALYLFSRGR